MRWPLTATIALAALPAVVVAQQEQRPQSQTEQPTYQQQGQAVGDSLTPQDTSRAAAQQVDTSVSTGEVITDSIGQVRSDTTRNQSQSGVVNDSGKSTLGPNIKKVKPTQGKHLKEPYKKGVRAKSDTTRGVSDSTAAESSRSDTTGTRLNEPYASGRQKRTGADSTHFGEPYRSGERSSTDTTLRTQTSTGEVSGAASDTMQNQTQSGVVDSSGASTLGPKVKKTHPAPDTVTLKGDTLKGGEPNRAGVASDTTGMARDTTKPPR